MTKPGLIRYDYKEGSLPDTRADVLSFGVVTPTSDAVLFRVDSRTSNDYIEAELLSGRVHVTYNLGTSDVSIGEANVRLDDGLYHVVRFVRSGENTTLQVDDNQIQTVYPGAKAFLAGSGRHLTVFNGQGKIQIGGIWNPTLKRVERPFLGVIAGVVYNGLRPLDEAE